MDGFANSSSKVAVVGAQQIDPPIARVTQTSGSLAHPKYRPDIDGLRAIAVLLVLGFHAFPSRVGGGFIGVDVFFVISGFLISGIIFANLENGNFTYREFQRRRIRRIFPALSVVLGATLIAGWFFLLAPEYENLGKHVAASTTFVPNFSLWGEAGYFDSAAELKPLLHLWSLGIEEQFYIFWPLLVSLLWRRGLSIPKLLIFISVLSFSVNIASTFTVPIAAFYSPLSRFWELMIGAGLSYLSRQNPQFLTRYANTRSVAGVCLMTFCTMVLSTQRAFPGWWALLPTVGAALVISAGRESWLNRKLLSSPPLVWIGKISYPLYLWHWPLISMAWIVGDGSPPARVRIGLVCLAFALAAVTYQFVEKPIQRDQRNAWIRVRHICASMFVVGLCGAWLYYSNGFRFRTIEGNPAGFDYDLASDEGFFKCFLNEDEKPPFNSLCDGARSGFSRPLVLIWGDSHAQSLALGLLEQSKLHDFDLARFTASACPPIIGFEVTSRPQCRLINQTVADKIKQLRPQTVLLSAFWYLYNGHEGYSKLDYDKLRATITFLKQQQISNIILVGQLPTFLIDEPKVGNRTFVSGRVDRTFYKFNYASAAVNNDLRSFAIESQVNFLSPLDIVCNDQGCLISTSRTAQVPLAWDYGHLTKAGANFVFETALREKVISLP